MTSDLKLPREVDRMKEYVKLYKELQMLATRHEWGSVICTQVMCIHLSNSGHSKKTMFLASFYAAQEKNISRIFSLAVSSVSWMSLNSFEKLKMKQFLIWMHWHAHKHSNGLK